MDFTKLLNLQPFDYQIVNYFIISDKCVFLQPLI